MSTTGHRAKREQQTVPWFELFYDLVIVAAVGHGTRVFGSSPSWGTGVVIAGAVLVLFSVWLLTSLHHGVFPGDDLVRRLLVLAQMAALAVAALSVGDRGVPTDAGLLALGAVLASICALWARTLLRDRASSPLTVPVVAGTGVGALLVALAAAIPGDALDLQVRIVAAAGVLAAVLPVVTVFLDRAVRARAIDPHHLEERLGTLVLVVLGESFADLLGSLADAGGIPNPLLFVLTFLVVYAIWTMYAASIAERGLPGSARGLRAWLAAHVLLAYGAIAVAASFADLTLVPFGDRSPDEPATWTTMPLAYVVASLAILAAISRAPRAILAVHLPATALLVGLALANVLGVDAVGDGNLLVAVGGVVVLVDALIVSRVRRLSAPLGGAPRALGGQIG